MKLAEVIEKELFRMKSSPVSISIFPGDSGRLAAAMASITLRLLKTMLVAAAGDATANVVHNIPNPTSALNFIRDLRKIDACYVRGSRKRETALRYILSIGFYWRRRRYRRTPAPIRPVPSRI